MTSPARKFNWLAWLLGLSLLINAGLVAGYVYHRYLMLPPPERWQSAQKTLQLTDAQRDDLHRLQRDLREGARRNMVSMRSHHHELVELLRRDEVDLATLESHLRATTEPQVGMQRDVILRMLAFRNTLNPEQKRIFNEKIERPGFLLHLAGFPGPMWRSHHCQKKDGRERDRHERRENGSPRHD
jgi:Spy/CpxP family protein refolding chaperone